MKIGSPDQRCCGLTRVEVLVAVLLTALLFVILIPMLLAARRRNERINCFDNLMQMSGALRIWEDDKGNTNSPWTALLETNAQTIGLNSGQIPWINAVGSSNIMRLSTVLHCPADTETPITTNASGLGIRISYFLNLDASEEYPDRILSGDDNLVMSGAPVKPGILEVSSNAPISWTTERHGNVCSFGFADGSVSMESIASLKIWGGYAVGGTDSFTNRLAIP